MFCCWFVIDIQHPHPFIPGEEQGLPRSPGKAPCPAGTAAFPPCTSDFPSLSSQVCVDSSHADICATDIYLFLRFGKRSVSTFSLEEKGYLSELARWSQSSRIRFKSLGQRERPEKYQVTLKVWLWLQRPATLKHIGKPHWWALSGSVCGEVL